MRSFLNKLTTAALFLTAAVTAVPETQAARIRLDGYGYYSSNSRVDYYDRAPRQSGRYSSLGSDYYHKVSYEMDFVSNRSSKRSGSLSYEFWAMRYYGGSKGIVLMTRGFDPLKGNRSYSEVYERGRAVDLDRKRFPEINIWEYTRNGWTFRDALSFAYKDWL